MQELLTHHASAELVLKLATPACRVISADCDEEIRAKPVADVVDTTAAGDSFAAAYLGAVVRHPGAIIPHAAMPVGLTFPARSQYKEMRA